VLQRDVRLPWVLQPALILVFRSIYDAVDRAYDLYEACESLVDVEDNFQFCDSGICVWCSAPLVSRPALAVRLACAFCKRHWS
jgi:hypothetical protein